jgi:hypothetical protein
MVSSIQGMGSMMGMGGISRQAQSLTDEQKQKIADILSQYDPENVSDEDAKAIFQAFKDAGITPAKGMKEAIEAAGFDAEDLRTRGMSDQGGRMPPPPPPDSGSSSGVNVSALQSLQEILSQYDLTDMTTDEQSQLLSQLQNQGLMNPGYIIDLKS